jgi:hypothetical protein
MNPFASFWNWLFGPPKFAITKRMTIGGVELEKILVHSKGREATLHEMLTVTSDARFEIKGGGEGSGFNCSTEQWDSLPGESEAVTIQRIADDIAAKYPGMSVIAFGWPGSAPTIIAVIVTLGPYELPPTLQPQYVARSKT